MSYKSILLTSMRSPWLDSDRIYPPLGILYLKSYLNQYGIEVGLEDNFDFGNPDKYSKYDSFGASVMTPQREASLNFLNFCKAHYKGKPVIIGGPHAQHYLSDVEKEKWDHIVSMDGQRALLHILQGSTVRIHYDFLDKEVWASMPRPDRTSIKAAILLSHYNYMLQGRRATTMLTALGCPGRCKFCTEAQTTVRRTNTDTIRVELNDIVNLGYKGVYLFDDVFALSYKLASPICMELQKRGLVYRCNGQAQYFDEEFAKLLADTGCVEIAFGAESGSQKILDVIDKQTTVEMNYKFVELCKKYGIVCKAFLMIGLPGETRETISETEKFIKESGIEDFQLSVFYPFKGTKLREAFDNRRTGFDLVFEKEGLGAYGQKGGSTEAVVRTSALSALELLQERDRLVHQYRPESHSNMWSSSVESKVEYVS